MKWATGSAWRVCVESGNLVRSGVFFEVSEARGLVEILIPTACWGRRRRISRASP